MRLSFARLATPVMTTLCFIVTWKLPALVHANDDDIIAREMSLENYEVKVVLNICPDEDWDSEGEERFSTAVAAAANDYCANDLTACNLRGWATETTFKPFHVQLSSDASVRRDLGSVFFSILIQYNPDMRILQDFPKALMPREAVSAILRGYGSRIQRSSSWVIVDAERFPKYDPVTKWMNMALVPVGLVVAILVITVARWSVSITASSELDLVMRIQRKRMKTKMNEEAFERDRMIDFRHHYGPSSDAPGGSSPSSSSSTDDDYSPSQNYQPRSQLKIPRVVLTEEDETVIPAITVNKPKSKRSRQSQRNPSESASYEMEIFTLNPPAAGFRGARKKTPPGATSLSVPESGRRGERQGSGQVSFADSSSITSISQLSIPPEALQRHTLFRQNARGSIAPAAMMREKKAGFMDRVIRSVTGQGSSSAARSSRRPTRTAPKPRRAQVKTKMMMPMKVKRQATIKRIAAHGAGGRGGGGGGLL